MLVNSDTQIVKFRDEYDFLSNMYECSILFEGITYTCTEAAFQAAKTFDEEDKLKLSQMSGRQAKRAGRKVKLREDWEDVKVDIMKQINMIKFSDPLLKEKLLSTKDKVLMEGNTWHDTFWGVDSKSGKGKNNLGKILMEVRDYYRVV